MVSSAKRIGDLEKHVKTLEKSGGKDDPKVLTLEKAVR